MISRISIATPRFRFCQSFQVSSGDGIFRCENAVFNEIEERVPEFFSDAFQITWNAFGTRSERVRNAFISTFSTGNVTSSIFPCIRVTAALKKERV